MHPPYRCKHAIFAKLDRARGKAQGAKHLDLPDEEAITTMKAFPPGYFTAPIYNGGTWPPGFKPTLYETWGHRAAHASEAACEAKDRRVANGCTASTGAMKLKGTPNIQPPKPIERPHGFKTDRMREMFRRPDGATTNDISAALRLTYEQASKRVANFNAELRRKGLPTLRKEKTGRRAELRYYYVEEDLS